MIKINSTVIGLAVGVLIVWLVGFIPGVVVPAEVAVAFGVITKAIVSALIPDEKEEV